MHASQLLDTYSVLVPINHNVYHCKTTTTLSLAPYHINAFVSVASSCALTIITRFMLLTTRLTTQKHLLIVSVLHRIYMTLALPEGVT